MNRIFGNRYGLDRLNILLLVFSLLFVFSRLLFPIGILMIAYAVFRASSRNHARRQMELRRFEIFFAKIGEFLDRTFRPVMNWINLSKQRKSHKKIYKYIKCRYCGKKLRLPRNKGKIKVTCPDCKNQFIIKT